VPPPGENVEETLLLRVLLSLTSDVEK